MLSTCLKHFQLSDNASIKSTVVKINHIFWHNDNFWNNFATLNTLVVHHLVTACFNCEGNQWVDCCKQPCDQGQLPKTRLMLKKNEIIVKVMVTMVDFITKVVVVIKTIQTMKVEQVCSDKYCWQLKQLSWKWQKSSSTFYWFLNLNGYGTLPSVLNIAVTVEGEFALNNDLIQVSESESTQVLYIFQTPTPNS